MTPWRDRLIWTGERSPSNAERIKAADAEIKDLRKEIAKLQRQISAMQTQKDQKLQAAKEKAAHWKKMYDQERKRTPEQSSTTGVRRVPQAVWATRTSASGNTPSSVWNWHGSAVQSF